MKTILFCLFLLVISASVEENKSESQNSIKAFLKANKTVFGFVLILLVGLFIVYSIMAGREFSRINDSREPVRETKLTARRVNVDEYEIMLNKNTQKEIEKLQRDPRYIETMKRDSTEEGHNWQKRNFERNYPSGM